MLVCHKLSWLKHVCRIHQMTACGCLYCPYVCDPAEVYAAFVLPADTLSCCLSTLFLRTYFSNCASSLFIASTW